MQVSLLLSDTLDELGANDFKRFKWILSQPVLDGCQPILKSFLEDADRQDTVTKMIEKYGEETAVTIAVEILKRMNQNNAAEKLMGKYAGVADHRFTDCTVSLRLIFKASFCKSSVFRW